MVSEIGLQTLDQGKSAGINLGGNLFMLRNDIPPHDFTDPWKLDATGTESIAQPCRLRKSL